MQSFHHGKITGVQLKDSRKQVKDQLANLEKAEGEAAKIVHKNKYVRQTLLESE